jgi:hypothetical protein
MGSDGIPAQIAGERVYRVGEQLEWQKLSGSFLLGGYVSFGAIFCGNMSTAQPSAEVDLIGCGGMALVSSRGGGTGGDGAAVAAHSGSNELNGWRNGGAIVARVHTRDAEAAQCSLGEQARCESALVVEMVIWPVVPAQIAGERVYRAVDQTSFPTSGTFLLGGPVTMPDVIPPCPMQPNLTTGEKDLIPYCYWQAIDGIQVAPKIDTLADLRNRIVVARVHIGDAEAASCPVTVQVQCKAAIVVEDVVWTGGAASSNQATNPTPVQTTPTSAFSETAGPATPRDQIEPDGVPTTLNGQPVYRAANLPTTASFLLGGTLTRDSTCAAPSTPLAKAPGCGYWMVDGVKVGTMVDLPESLLDQPVVVQIDRSRSLAVCPGGSCTSTTLVIAAIVWPEPPSVVPATPAAT